MKKTFVKIVAIALALITVSCMLASCGTRLSGTYTKEESGVSVSFTFKGNKVTLEMDLSILGEYEIEGTYKIDGDEITFDFTDADDEGGYMEELFDEFTDGVEFEKGKDYIKIAGEKYEKE